MSESSMMNISLVLIKPKIYNSVLLFNKRDYDEYSLPRIQLDKNEHLEHAADRLLKDCISKFLDIKRDVDYSCYNIDLEPFYALDVHKCNKSECKINIAIYGVFLYDCSSSDYDMTMPGKNERYVFTNINELPLSLPHDDADIIKKAIERYNLLSHNLS